MIESGSARIAAYDFGGDGPDLLLAHATGFHAHAWLPVVEHLRDRFHCYAFDERAHGHSTPPADGDYDWHRFADDALAVADGFGLHRPCVAGHSCGGALVLLAEQARPGSFRALWCYEPVIFPTDEPPPPDTENPLSAGARRRREVFPSLEAAYENFAAKPPMSRFDPAALRAYVEHGFAPVEGADGEVRILCRGADEASTYDAGLFHDAFPRLREVIPPVTLVCGEHTDAFGVDALRLDAARLPHARLEVLPGLTHFGPFEDPAAIAASIARAFEAA
ncbi:MAG TPA: alpha/beta hydrolase [Acidimicrobiales bacterium]|nr:alpha/beta hydrolase [Acidimicrobiales bacterium]